MCVFLLLLLASCTEEIQCCLCGFVLFVGLSGSVTVFGTLGFLEGVGALIIVVPILEIVKKLT